MTNKKCKDCYWYSNYPVECCDREHDPAKAEDEACSLFEENEEKQNERNAWKLISKADV